jgi:uncharacterized circularly permuted ATP-grasp superfamily protein
MGAPRWRCDPVPFLLTEGEFGFLARGLAQRAHVLEAMLRDVYGPMDLLRSGLLPPALVYPSANYVRPCRNVAGARHIHLYAADLMRAPDGRWHVLADHTAEPAGLGHVLENRRMMARVLPDMFRSVQVAQIRPFFDTWQDLMQRLAPRGGSPGLALLSPGHADRRWFEHVVLARELGCALVEDGDLTARAGALWIKTLRGLSPVHVLLRYQSGVGLDPLELHEDASVGVPGLFAAMRAGTVQVMNGPGAGFAESPALAPLLPALSRVLLGQDLLLPSVEAHWLGDPDGLAQYHADPAAWRLRSAFRRAGTMTGLLEDRQREFAAQRVVPPSCVPCVTPGEMLEPRGVTLRLYLLHFLVAWRVWRPAVPAAVSCGRRRMFGCWRRRAPTS